MSGGEKENIMLGSIIHTIENRVGNTYWLILIYCYSK